MYRLTVDDTSTPSTDIEALECVRRASRRPEPLPIERVKAGFLGRRVVRAMRRVLDMERQQSGKRVGDEERWDDIRERSMVGVWFRAWEVYLGEDGDIEFSNKYDELGCGFTRGRLLNGCSIFVSRAVNESLGLSARFYYIILR